MKDRIVRSLTGGALALMLVVGVNAQTAPDSQPEQSQRTEKTRRMRKGGHRGFAFGQLNLTDEQKTQIQGIFKAQRESSQALREQLRSKHQALRAASTAATYDEAAVRAAAQDLARVQAELTVARAKAHNEVLQVLTPEQRTKLNELRQQRQGRFNRRHERRS